MSAFDHTLLNVSFADRFTIWYRVNEILWSFYHSQAYIGRTALDEFLSDKFFKEIVKRSIRPSSQEMNEFSMWIHTSSYTIRSFTHWDEEFKRSGRNEPEGDDEDDGDVTITQ